MGIRSRIPVPQGKQLPRPEGAVLLAVRKGDVEHPPVRVADDPGALLLAVHERTFPYVPACPANDPVPVLLPIGDRPRVLF